MKRKSPNTTLHDAINNTIKTQKQITISIIDVDRRTTVSKDIKADI